MTRTKSEGRRVDHPRTTRGMVIAMFMGFVVLWSVLCTSPAVAEDLAGTVISVDGQTVTVETEIVEGLTPGAGDSVELIQTLDGGRMKIPAGRWVVEKVNGVFVTAVPGADVRQPPERGMEAVIHVSRGRGYRSGPDVLVPGDAASTPRGKVVMIRGNDVTIVLDSGVSSVVPESGDLLDLNFTVAGEPIRVGTWRVSAVKDKGTLEAEPVEIKREPTLGLQAVFLPRERKKTDAAAPGSTGRRTTVQGNAEETALPEKLERSKETVVTPDFSRLDETVPCKVGTVRVAGGRIEMDGSSLEHDYYCVFPISDAVLENVRVSVGIEVKGGNFLAGLVFGDLNGVDYSPKTLGVFLATQTTSKTKWSGLIPKRIETTSSWFVVRYLDAAMIGDDDEAVFYGDDLWQSYLLLPSAGDDSGEHVTRGTLEFIDNGNTWRLIWNGKVVEPVSGSRMDDWVRKGKIGIMFKPVAEKGQKAVFRNITVKRLE